MYAVTRERGDAKHDEKLIAEKCTPHARMPLHQAAKSRSCPHLRDYSQPRQKK